MARLKKDRLVLVTVGVILLVPVNVDESVVERAMGKVMDAMENDDRFPWDVQDVVILERREQ